MKNRGVIGILLVVIVASILLGNLREKTGYAPRTPAECDCNQASQPYTTETPSQCPDGSTGKHVCTYACNLNAGCTPTKYTTTALSKWWALFGIAKEVKKEDVYTGKFKMTFCILVCPEVAKNTQYYEPEALQD